MRYDRAFAIGIALNAGFVVVEWLFGIWANSLALIADASHNLGDVLGLVLAGAAAVLARRRPSPHYTYGLRGTTILAAIANAALLLVIAGGIAWEALLRLRQPEEVDATVVIGVATLGIVINTATALMFASGRKHDVNLRGVYLHMAADAAVSLGVVIAALGVLATGWVWLDPAVSLAIVAVIVGGTWGLLRDAVRLALHAVPEGIDPSQVRGFLEQQAGVREVHDLHIWAMSTTEIALTAHLVMPGGHPGDPFLAELAERIHRDLGIAHATLQVETDSGERPCALAPDHVV